MAKILIVDGDNNFTGSTSEMLTQAGFDAKSAATAADFVSSVETDPPDLILLDISLENPEDGLTTASKLAAKGITPPVIILDNVAKIATLGVDTSEISVEAYAEKPLEQDKIVTKINAILNR